MLQGPCTRAKILKWADAGYFTPSLPIRAAAAPPDAPFWPLLEVWLDHQRSTPECSEQVSAHLLPPPHALQVCLFQAVLRGTACLKLKKLALDR